MTIHKRLHFGPKGVHHVLGLAGAQMHIMSKVWKVLQAKKNPREIGPTNANEHRNSSHYNICVMVKKCVAC